MNDALSLVGWGCLVALTLAVVIEGLCLTRWLRQRPALRHALWLLVLLKLIVPSLVSVVVLPARIEPKADANAAPTLPDLAAIGSDLASGPANGRDLQDVRPRSLPSDVGGMSLISASAQMLLERAWQASFSIMLGLSCVGSCLLALFAIRRCHQFHRLVWGNAGESGRTDKLLRDVAESFHEVRPPRVLVVNAQVTPMLWGTLRHPVIVLPRALIESLNDEQVRSIVAHELAHFVRRDHWTNTLAFCVTTLLWWNPVAWIARRRLAEAAELCCDALVIERLLAGRKCYAQTLLQVVDFLTTVPPRRLAVAINFGKSRSLRRRFEMLADSRVTSRVSRLGCLLLILGAGVSMLIPARAELVAEAPAAPTPALTEAPISEAKKTDEAASAGETANASAGGPGTAVKERATVKGFGTVVDPDGDCQFKQEDESVTIVVPKLWHDLTYTDHYTTRNAPRILQAVQGDFSLEVKVEPFELPNNKPSSGGDHSFVSSGLLLWQNDRNFVRFERAAVGGPFIWVERFQDGKSALQDGLDIEDKDTYLRATRKGNSLTLETSQDGHDWKHVAAVEVNLPEQLDVGVAAINSTRAPFSATLKGLKLIRPAPSEQDSAAKAVWPMQVQVVDEATRQPIANPGIVIEWGKVKTSYEGDASGEVALALPSRTPSFFYLRARAAGYAPMRAFWSTRKGQVADELPASFTFAMSRAIKVGGRVVDDQGKPVAGAKVFFSAGDGAALTGLRTEASFFDEEYTTDAEGRWECDLAPPTFNRGSIHVDHPDYARVYEHWSVDDHINELRAGTHTWTLMRCFKVRGRVTDPDGKPVAGARLAIGHMNSYPDHGPFPTTDADGRYEFTRVGPSSGWPVGADPRLTITAIKVGLAPMLQHIGGWEPGADPAARYADRTVNFQLTRGFTLRIRVVDRDGRGIAAIRVLPDDWHGTRPFWALGQYGVPQKTDADGVWEWSWAPPREEIKYDIFGEGYMDVRDQAIVADKDVKDVLITLRRPQVLTGRVVDVETKQPIESFVVQKGLEGGNDKPDGVYWELSADTRGRNGLYTKSITMPPHNGSYRYRVLAEGYQPRTSESVRFDEGEATLDFELMPITDGR